MRSCADCNGALFFRCGNRADTAASVQAQKPVVPEKYAAGFGDVVHGAFRSVPPKSVKRILDGRQAEIRQVLTGPANTAERYISAWEADSGNYFLCIFTYDTDPCCQVGMVRVKNNITADFGGIAS